MRIFRETTTLWTDTTVWDDRESLIEGKGRGAPLCSDQVKLPVFHLGKKSWEFLGENNLNKYSKPFKKRKLDTSKL